MRASSTLFLLLPCIASLENVLNEDSVRLHLKDLTIKLNKLFFTFAFDAIKEKRGFSPLMMPIHSPSTI